MQLDARSLVDRATDALGIDLADLIALASVWVSPDVFQIARPCGGTWFPERRRANLGLRVNGRPVEAVGQVIDGVTLDSNNYANVAFKQAIGVDRLEFVGFHICHIWPGTAYDARYFTNVANLVGIPAELSSLTDHHPHIIECLKFRSWELYGWKPEEAEVPSRPNRYPTRWAEPQKINEASRRAAMRKAGANRRSSGASLDATARLPVVKTTARPSTEVCRVVMSGDAAKDAAIFAALYLARFEHQRLQLGNQGETFDAISRGLGVNVNSVRQYRDYFDSFTDSLRHGWKKPLPPQLKSVFDRYRHLDEDAMRSRVLQSIGRKA